ncbi:hypothetical protein [Rickettsia oklahomensis]|uniref:Uncharacterized protein n=1 Tax=Rickettsia oklahomensis TaxID=3141789 RepID=A0AAU7BZQ8_9RICK
MQGKIIYVLILSTIPARLIADFLEKLGVNHVITIDLHSEIEKFFKIPVSNLKPTNIIYPVFKNF